MSWRVLAVLVALAGVALPSTQTVAPAQQQLQSPAPGQSVIVGRVLDGDSAGGVAGATVTLRSPALGQPPAQFTDGTPAGPRVSRTDGDGQFLFRGLPAGTYQMSATAIGYREGIYGDTRIIQIRRSLDLTRSITITETDRLITGNVRIWKNGGLGGRVVDEAGEPMVGVPVTAIARHVDWGGPFLQPADSAMTDDRGIYHLDVSPGDYIVGVLAATITAPVSAVEMFEQASRTGSDALNALFSQVAAGAVAIPPRGNVARLGDFVVGQFEDLTGRRHPAAPFARPDGVTMIYPSTFYPASRTTAGATAVTAGSGTENLGLNLTLVPIPARRLAGRVVGPDGPVPNLRLNLIPPDPSIARTSPAFLVDPIQAMSDRDGAFAFFGVPPGTYVLSAIRRPSADGEPTLWARTELSMGEADVMDLVIGLQNGVRLSGRFVYDGAAKPPDFRRGLIQMIALPGTVGALAGSSIGDRVDEAGRFTTREIIPGAVMASAQLQGYVVKSITSAGQNIMDRPFQVTSAGASDIVVTVSDRLGTVTGIARDTRNEPSPLATVAIFPADTSLWRVPGMTSRRVRTAAPERDGRYTFVNLPAGDYMVVAVDWPTADFSDGNVLTKVMPSATRITLTDSTSTTQDLRVLVVR